MSLAGGRQAVIDALVAAGLANVTGDPRNVQPPAVLVGMPTALTPAPCGAMGTVAVWVLAPPPANADALDDLLARLATAQAAVTWDRADEGVYTPVANGPELPGYRLTVPITS